MIHSRRIERLEKNAYSVADTRRSVVFATTESEAGRPAGVYEHRGGTVIVVADCSEDPGIVIPPEFHHKVRPDAKIVEICPWMT